MKVVRVTHITLDKPVPVYDLDVPGNNNFKLSAGPVVHNSKDCSDALAGIIFGLSTRREIWWLHGVAIGEIPISIAQHAGKSNVAGVVAPLSEEPPVMTAAARRFA